MEDWLQYIITIILSIIATLAASSFIFKIVYKKTEIKTEQKSDHSAVNVGNVIGSNVIIQTNEAKPIKTDSILTQTDIENSARDLLKKIEKEKISVLLQEAKLIAHDSKDKEMSEWITHELESYFPPSGKQLTRKEAKEKGLIPDYRDINGKFYVQISDGSIHDMNYPVLLGNDIKQVENMIGVLERGGQVSIKLTFPPSTPLVGGRSGDLELPLTELRGIVHGAERKLSRFLESKLST